MDILQLLLSLNIVSVVFFVITFGFLIFEMVMFFKDRKGKNVPSVPNFDPRIKTNLNTGPVAQTAPPIPLKRKNRTVPIVVAIVLLVVFGSGIGGVAYWKKTRSVTITKNSSPPPIIQNGIALYSKSWDDISPQDVGNDNNKTVYIGLQTIQGVDVDKARIRVNSSSWTPENVTTNFNVQKGVYYIEYKIASGESKLQIDGQLHSKKGGWPE